MMVVVVILSRPTTSPATLVVVILSPRMTSPAMLRSPADVRLALLGAALSGGLSFGAGAASELSDMLKSPSAARPALIPAGAGRRRLCTRPGARTPPRQP